MGIVRTFQKTTVFRRETVLDNVIIGKILKSKTNVLSAVLRTPFNNRIEKNTIAEASEIVSFVGLSDKEELLADELPEEAQKRLSIAVALATDPKLLLLDEPNGGVNLEESDGLMDVIKRVRARGVTVCLIEHKMRMVMSISDRVMVLNYGRKIAEGTPSEVANDQQVIKAYLGERYAA